MKDDRKPRDSHHAGRRKYGSWACWIIGLFVVGILASQAVYAQCSVIAETDVAGFPSSAIIRRILSGNPTSVACTNQMSMNAVLCYVGAVAPGVLGCPPGTAQCLAFVARATMVSNPTSRYCSWDCGPCGTVRIDNSDGLPVELMEFSIDDDGADTESDEAETSEEDTEDSAG